MKFLKKLLKWILLLLILLVATSYLTDTDYLLKAVRTIYLRGHTTAFLEDYTKFDNRTMDVGVPQPWPNHKNHNSVKETDRLMEFHKAYQSIAYVIIKNDSIWFENYYDGFTEDSKSNSFSMAKSYVSAMLGKAIMEGKIESLQQPVSDFFPEFDEGYAAELTVGDLSSMASGSSWDEAYYSPFSITTRAYFYDDLRKMMLERVKIIEEPGQEFKYLSGNTELLGMVIEKATGKHLTEYLTESFWKPLGAENQALWQLDSQESGMEKAYCCIASNAKDFARLGKLYKDHGKWNGRQLLDSAFIKTSVTPRFPESPQYGYGWWLIQDYMGKDFFMMRGHLGQYVIVQPDDNVIIVRLGHLSADHDNGGDSFTEDIYAYIDEAYTMMSSHD